MDKYTPAREAFMFYAAVPGVILAMLAFAYDTIMLDRQSHSAPAPIPHTIQACANTPTTPR